MVGRTKGQTSDAKYRETSGKVESEYTGKPRKYAKVHQGVEKRAKKSDDTPVNAPSDIEAQSLACIEPPLTPRKKHYRSIVPVIERYRLRDMDSRYLHLSGKGFTDKVSLAWWGIEAQADMVISKNPKLKLQKVRYQ